MEREKEREDEVIRLNSLVELKGAPDFSDAPLAFL